MTNIAQFPTKKQPTAVVRVRDTILVTGYIASARHELPNIIVITLTSGKEVKIFISPKEKDTILDQLYAAILKEETAKFPIPIFDEE